jgi:hypothetical protein
MILTINFYYNGELFDQRRSLHHPQLGEHIQFSKEEGVYVLVVQEVLWKPDQDAIWVYLQECPRHNIRRCR